MMDTGRHYGSAVHRQPQCYTLELETENIRLCCQVTYCSMAVKARRSMNSSCDVRERALDLTAADDRRHAENTHTLSACAKYLYPQLSASIIPSTAATDFATATKNGLLEATYKSRVAHGRRMDRPPRSLTAYPAMSGILY